MASHHHCHPHPAASCCRSHSGCCHPPPPPPQQQNHLYSFCQNSSPQVDLYHHHLELEAQTYPPPPIHHSQQQFFQLRRKPTPEETYPSVSSLIRRIAALESSLLRHRLSSASASAWSLRDVAARTIQIHFRSFLARRSRTLSQLKELASVRSALHSLKASTAGNAQFDPQSISRKAMALLQKLESIQGGDPMIRDGKRSIHRELIRFMDLIDRVCVNRVVRSTRHHRVNNSRVFVAEDEKELRGRSSGIANKTRGFMEEDEEGGFDIGDRSAKTGSSHSRIGGLLEKAGGSEGEGGKVRKTVTFADDSGKLYRATIATPERNWGGEEEEEEEDDSIELVDNVGRIVEEIEGREDEDEAGAGEEEDEDEDSSCKDEFVFSPPLPVKMSRRGAAALIMKKMKR